MAEGPKNGAGVKELEQEITCAICHEHYQEPKVLSCCHYYCKQCIYRLALKTGLDKPFSCPECRKDTTLPQGSVDNLQAAFFINRMKEVHSKLERATGKVEAKCEICCEDKAEAFCRQCEQFICAECVKQHQRMKKVFPGHRIVSLDELKEGKAKDIVVQERVLPICKLHEEKMKIFCFDCGCLICRDCTVKDHFGHNYEFIKKAAPETKKKLSQQLVPLRETKESLTYAVMEIQTSRSEVEAQGHSVARHIEDSFEELLQVLVHHKQQLLTEATSQTAHKLESLSVQEKSLSTACAVVQSVIDYTEQCVEHLADDQIMCMHAELQSRIDREIEEQQKEGRNLGPAEEADMAVELGVIEELKELCQTKAMLAQIPFKCSVSSKKTVTKAEVNVNSELTIKAAFANGKPTKRKCGFKCHLKTLADGSTVDCKVEPIRGGEYNVQYMPTVRGRHELVVTVNGDEISDSPFPVFVSIHPEKLGKPVQVLTGLKQPVGVAINSEGEIIVSEFRGSLVVLDRKGNTLRSLKSNFNSPRAVAVDEDGYIYLVEEHKFVIRKINKKMNVITKKRMKQQQSGHEHVAVVKDEIMVCEKHDLSVIKVYNKKLEYVREINYSEAGELASLSSDEHGNLYVGDVKNSCIQVFSNGGQFLRSFGSNKDGVNKPYGVCVAGQYVYVTDQGCHSVRVFTTEGKYVTSFGHKSEKEKLYYPLGICVDRDGYVCVCDQNNHRIQIF